KGTGQHADEIDPIGYARYIAQREEGEQAAYKEKEWCARRVRHFELVRNRDEFTAIPVAGGLLHREPIGRQCNGENDPATDIIDLLKIHEKRGFGNLRCENTKKPGSPYPSLHSHAHSHLRSPGLFVHDDIKTQPQEEDQDVGTNHNQPYYPFVLAGIKMDAIKERNAVWDFEQIECSQRIGPFPVNGQVIEEVHQ